MEVNPQKTSQSSDFSASPYQIDTEMLTDNGRAMSADSCSLNCAQEGGRVRFSNAFRSRSWSAR